MADLRSRILGLVREALAGREPMPHPGPSPVRGPATPGGEELPGRGAGPDLAEPRDRAPAGSMDVAASFASAFEAAGGEVVLLSSVDAAAEWLRGFERAFDTVAESPLIPESLRSQLPGAPPPEAALGVSMGIGAAADTGSLLLSSREGRPLQLLPSTLLVWVPIGSISEHLEELLARHRGMIPRALALHSGPSKSADIGRILVTGVHGPGRVVAAVVPVDATV